MENAASAAAQNQPPAASQNESEIKVFTAAETQPVIPAPAQEPEDDLQPTAEEVRRAQASLTQRNKALNERTFSLARDREADKAKAEQKKVEKWPNTTIRIRFSDRTQIQKVFPSSSRIGTVYDFVRSSLNDESRTKPFTLYEPPAKQYPETTPPLPATYIAQQRKVPAHLRKPPPPDPSKQSLMELQLVPQSVLLVRFEDDEMNRSDAKAPLLPELLQQAAPLPPPPDFNQMAAASGSTSQAGGSGTGKTGEKKIPKWLQKGLLKKK
ncbi:hypothetical protein FFLO_01671 [Filobasidium floriforme]|uniref:UBX domain-containing protein n=1 Tax=Filobasidium floriforme TaxID=5210 RepID=A0A8K0JQ66_9TREE|nr:uncharacterized protein HD553DRAFT_309732 [Filobasidium floriforme]KAG7562842.1 hypothetical protein FFLO_01671 [Filobasidium floriforme]KAH8086472.1 hypothetical protein HD553DRAFT_309732 [Filobasidium floriforme]